MPMQDKQNRQQTASDKNSLSPEQERFDETSAPVADGSPTCPKTIRELLCNFEEADLEREAFRIKEGDQYRAVTYALVLEQVRNLGNALLQMGVKKGDRVGLLSENRIEWPIAYLAITSIGATALSLDIFLKKKEVDTILGVSEPCLVFTTSRYLDKILDPGQQTLRQVITFDAAATDKGMRERCESRGLGYDDFPSLCQKGKALLDDEVDLFGAATVFPEDIATIIFLSTTLGVSLSNRSIMANVEGMLNALGRDDNRHSRWLSVLPFHHAWPTVNGFLAPLMLRSTITILSTTKLDAMFQAIRENRIDYLMIVPVLVERIYETLYQEARVDGLFEGLRLPASASLAESFEKALAGPAGPPLLEKTKERLGLNYLTCFFSAGAHLFPGTAWRMHRLGIDVLNVYGLTETSPVISHDAPRNKRIGSAGRPFAKVVQIKIDRPDEKGRGEILARGDIVMAGYYNNPEKTREVIDEEGWLHTGDIGRLDGDGYLYITGRSKNIIVTQGGKNIYPGEVEGALKESPLINDAIMTAKIKNEREYGRVIIQPDVRALSAVETERNRRLDDGEIRKLLEGEFEKATADIAHYKLPEELAITFAPIDREGFLKRNLRFDEPVDALGLDRGEAPEVGLSPHGGPVDSEDADPSRWALAALIEKFLRAKIAAVLKVPEGEVDGEERFFSYLTSIEIVEISAIIESEVKIKLYPPMLFEHTSVLALSGFFAEAFGEAFKSLFGREAIEAELTTGAGMDGRVREAASGRAQKFAKWGGAGKTAADEPVAIIGISGRFPGSRDVNEFWRHLEAGDDLISEIPRERFDWEAYYGDPLSESNKMITRWGGFIDDIDKFDSSFFKISPKEARLMDPQQRIFLETVYKTIEDAGYKPSSLSGMSVGLFAGVTTFDYCEVIRDSVKEVGVFAYTGTSPSVLPNRISYLLDIHGPSEVVDTACSSALVAIHRARRAILNGECELAIAGGVNALLRPELFISFSKAGMLSPDGRCKTFSSDANGYVRGEGVGAVLLKPLSRAIADQDHVYGVIKGSAVNHGGRASSFTSPNPKAQADLLIAAYEDAGVAPESVGYIEAHGTGTGLGDPIEINGLKKAFEQLYRNCGKQPAAAHHCGIGSVKTNIGHLESAAGIAGLIKILMAMRHRLIPASINFKEISPYVDMEESPFFVVEELQAWPRLDDGKNGAFPKRAGVSSFGVGGTNAHIVVEEFIAEPQDRTGEGQAQIVVLSARTGEQLRSYAAELAAHLERAAKASPAAQHDDAGLRLEDIAFTLQKGREEMAERIAVVAANKRALAEKLKEFLAAHSDIEGLYRGTVKKSGAASVPAEEISAEQVGQALAKQDLGEISRLWSLGAIIDWGQLPWSRQARRIPLPTYPFARKRCWIRGDGVS